MSSPRSRLRISEIISSGKLFGLGDWAERHGGRPRDVKSNLKKGKPWLF